MFPGGYLKSLLGLVLGLPFVGGCTARTTVEDGFAVYRDLAPKAGYSYAFADDAAPDLKRLLAMTVSHWNQALGRDALRVADDFRAADVKVVYTRVPRVIPSPAHLELLGCMEGMNRFVDCTIRLEIPRKLDTSEEMAKVAHLFRQGPLDERLYEEKSYGDVADYLHDKLVVLSLVHEVGHTLGLAHADDPSCVMAAAPAGELKFCAAELKAAKLRLSLAASP